MLINCSIMVRVGGHIYLSVLCPLEWGSRAKLHRVGVLLLSLFSGSGWETSICHDSSSQQWEVLGWFSMTVTWSQSIAWFLGSACSAATDMR